MVTQHFKRSFGFLKTTAIGGIFFLFPIVVIGVLAGQLLQVVAMVASALTESPAKEYLEGQTPAGYGLLFIAALAVIILACFFCGVLARQAIARKFTRSVEKYLLMLFPRYSIFKEQLSGNIGHAEYKNRLLPVLVQFDDYQRVAFEVERSGPGDGPLSDVATVYLPGSPDPWSGTVVLVPVAKVTPIHTDFLTASGSFETLGQGMQALITRSGLEA